MTQFNSRLSKNKSIREVSDQLRAERVTAAKIYMQIGREVMKNRAATDDADEALEKLARDESKRDALKAELKVIAKEAEEDEKRFQEKVASLQVRHRLHHSIT